MITVPPKKLLFGLFLISGIMVGILALVFHLNQAQRQHKELKRVLDLLNSSFEAELHSFQQERDSLEVIIVHQEKEEERLKDQIAELEEYKAAINRKTDEQKIDILRIRAIDDLYNEVARHYRR